MDTEQILEVQDVVLSILESNPPQLSITALGTVRNSGWKDAELVPYVYVQPPEDGIYDFDFVATPPDGVVAQVITPIQANYRLQNIPENLKGVRVHASLNVKVALLGKKIEAGAR